MEETTHARTVELLPWLINGTLDPGARRRVEEHLEDCLDCRSELSATRDAFAVYSAHLPAAAVVGYAEAPEAPAYAVDGGHAEGGHVERGVVEIHLAHCDRCLKDLSLTRESLERMEGTGTDGHDGAVTTGIATVTPFARPGGATTSVEGARSTPGTTSTDAGYTTPRWVPMALAASLLLAMVGAGGWITTAQHADAQRQELALLESHLKAAEERARAAETATSAEAEERIADYRREMGSNLGELEARADQAEERASLADRRAEELSRGIPAGGVVFVPLGGGDVLRSGDTGDSADPAAASPRIELSRAGGVLLQPDVDPALLGEWETVDYRVTDAGGRLVHEGSMPVVDETDQGLGRYVTLFLPSGLLPPGTATLELRAGGGEIGRYPFRVER